MHQSKYAKDILNQFCMVGCKPISTLLASGFKPYKEHGEAKADVTIFRSLISYLFYLLTS